MTSFGWKRKIGGKVSKEASSNFETRTGVLEDSSEDGGHHDDNLWDSFSKKRKVMLLEDAASKSSRLRAEGETLADAGRFWEAITKWDEALQYAPSNKYLHEMKAQVLMELHEVYPAVAAAQQATVLAPHWWVAHQTLGRAQLGLGEITMAVRSFSRAIHMNPAESVLWEEDLTWACILRDQLRARTKNSKQENQTEAQQVKALKRMDACESDSISSQTATVSRLSLGDTEESQDNDNTSTKRQDGGSQSRDDGDFRTASSAPDEQSLYFREGFR